MELLNKVPTFMTLLSQVIKDPTEISMMFFICPLLSENNHCLGSSVFYWEAVCCIGGYWAISPTPSLALQLEGALRLGEVPRTAQHQSRPAARNQLPGQRDVY